MKKLLALLVSVTILANLGCSKNEEKDPSEITEQTRKTIRAFFDALQAHDRGKFREILADDAILINPSSGETLEGADSIITTVWPIMDAFPDFHPEVITLIADGKQAAVETLRVGTHHADLVQPTGTIPATGRKISLPECVLFQVENGKVTSMRVHTDRLTIQQQLGLTPN